MKVDDDFPNHVENDKFEVLGWFLGTQVPRKIQEMPGVYQVAFRGSFPECNFAKPKSETVTIDELVHPNILYNGESNDLHRRISGEAMIVKKPSVSRNFDGNDTNHGAMYHLINKLEYRPEDLIWRSIKFKTKEDAYAMEQVLISKQKNLLGLHPFEKQEHGAYFAKPKSETSSLVKFF